MALTKEQEHRPVKFMKILQTRKEFFLGKSSLVNFQHEKINKKYADYNHDYRNVLYNIYKDRHKLLAADLPKTRCRINALNEVKETFENDMKDEIGKLEGKMKIGWSTMKRLALKLRLKKYNDCEELKNFKFSKNYLKRFVKEYEVTFTRRKSNQKKFSKEELNELRKPINELLSRFPMNRIINMDEIGLPLGESHQKGSFTVETDMDNFKGCVLENILSLLPLKRICL